jgi:hypothetical protein
MSTTKDSSRQIVLGSSGSSVLRPPLREVAPGQHPPKHTPTPQKKDKRRFTGKMNRPLPSHVQSGPDPALCCARKISGRPCVPGRLWKNRAPAVPPPASEKVRKEERKKIRIRKGRRGARLLTLLPSYLPLVGGSARISAHAGPPGDLTLERNRQVRSRRAQRREKHDSPLPRTASSNPAQGKTKKDKDEHGFTRIPEQAVTFPPNPCESV